MAIFRFKLGWILAACYEFGFIYEYQRYLQNSRAPFADLLLQFLAVPYAYVVSVLTQDRTFSVTGSDSGQLIVAALFGGGVMWLLGAAIQMPLWYVWSEARGRPQPGYRKLIMVYEGSILLIVLAIVVHFWLQ